MHSFLEKIDDEPASTDCTAMETMSNIKEVKARKGTIIGVTKEGIAKAIEECDDVITIPEIDQIFTPLLSVIPLQLLATTCHRPQLRRRQAEEPGQVGDGGVGNNRRSQKQQFKQ